MRKWQIVTENPQNNLIWRSRHDCERNSTSMLAQAHFSAKTLHGLSSKEQKEKLKNEKQINWDDEPNWFKYGALVKKELYMKKSSNPKTGEEVEAQRSRMVTKSFQLRQFSETLVQVVLGKYWDESFETLLTEQPELIVQGAVLEE